MPNRSLRKLAVPVLILVLIGLGACVLFQQPRFGASPDGARQRRIEHSPHYSAGEFHNLMPTKVLAEGQGTFSILMHDALNPVDGLKPDSPLPAVKIDLKALDANQDLIVWLGHSSFYVQIGGKRILIDPVLSAYASPFSFSIPAFAGSTIYGVDDFPPIDLLLITHDHWDHLDYDTLTALRERVARVLVPLGVGAHLVRWNYFERDIQEGDWYEHFVLAPGVSVHLVPARHYSGRLFKRNQTLWTGYVLETPTRRLLFSGDTGYGSHFKEIAARFGGFDLVALDMGQYDPRWPAIHMTPEQASQAAEDLQAKMLMPAHVGRFSIARHTWSDPLDRIARISQQRAYRLVTPPIGAAMRLDEPERISQPWWQLNARSNAAR